MITANRREFVKNEKDASNSFISPYVNMGKSRQANREAKPYMTPNRLTDYQPQILYGSGGDIQQVITSDDFNINNQNRLNTSNIVPSSYL